MRSSTGDAIADGGPYIDLRQRFAASLGRLARPVGGTGFTTRLGLSVAGRLPMIDGGPGFFMLRKALINHSRRLLSP
jgi:hypothetical protein